MKQKTGLVTDKQIRKQTHKQIRKQTHKQSDCVQEKEVRVRIGQTD